MMDRPATAVVRGIAHRWLADARAAAGRLDHRQDADALHDFRVAIRRLRSALRAWERWAGRAAARKVRRRLRDLGRRTNPGRDAEVQIRWLEAQRHGLARRERAGLNWLLKRLRPAAARRHLAGLRRDLARVAAPLEERLTRLDAGDVPFGPVLAQVLSPHAREAAERLAAVRDADDVEAAHDARISVKRLRYLLDPVAPHLPDGRAHVRRLKKLQDVIGNLHDAHVMEDVLRDALAAAAGELAIAGNTAGVTRARRRDERLGLATLAARNRERRDTLFRALDADWLRGNAAALIRTLEHLADTLRSRTPAADGLPREIERKYLLTTLPPAARDHDPVLIEQGWLPGEALQERLRRVEANGSVHHLRTVKLGRGEVRTEVEEETPTAVFDTMWPLTEGQRVSRRRYRVPAEGLVWEVDEFLGRDLVLAEIELPSADADVAIPEWLRPYVDREVTGEPAYLNVNLAT